jgi:hypothetical protein
MHEAFEDRELNCVDCGSPFTWAGGEQAFYQKQGFSEPKRCKRCREAKRAQFEDKTAHREDAWP